MNEKDAIKDLFSNAFEQHSASVRPEVWKGLQAKMAAAGVAGTSAAAVKGISALTKWIIGGAAVVATATVATVLLTEDRPQSSPVDKHIVAAQTTPEPANEENTVQTVVGKNDSSSSAESGRSSSQVPISGQDNSQAPEQLPITGVPVHNIPPVKQNSTAEIPEKTTEPTGQKSENPIITTDPLISEQQNEAGIITTGVAQPVARITRIPNVLTPNHDGDNDEFFIESENITDFSVVFLNAAGIQVYRSADPAFRWDGTDFNGDPVPNGQYRCIIVASGPDKKPIKRLEMVVVAR